MQVRVLYFGIVRERIANTREEPVTLPVGSSLKDLMSRLCGSHPGLDRMAAHLKLAVNEDIVDLQHRLTDGDVIALIPPVAGGAEPYCRITDQPLSLDEVLAAVSGPGKGGIVIFIGYVRDNSQGRPVNELEYEAYGSMAHRSLVEIVRQCESAAPGVGVAVAHRTGRLKVGEVVVIVAASAPHRGEAFQAARDCAERLKAETPIWKKEIGPDGEVWVETPDDLQLDGPVT
ncbi:molybdopterin converting factor subunit 1 [Actinoallomurus vinaceus]|uniref:Molybdopterin converting factor subunit 1 n=2 Tax=Actinoallomurus vinaceus TaxID=1080074 RepID=A0ABP8UVK6_9ACTN